jgi:type I restriction enzyme R subunit
LALGAEGTAVQYPLIRYAEDAGWEYVSRERASELRRGDTGIVLHDVLIRQLQRLNPGTVDHIRAEDISKRLLRISPTIEGNLDAWEYLKGLKTVFVETENRERNIRLLDLVNVGANTFQVTDELRFTNGTHRIRADVVFLINGIPVIIVETKAATHIEGIAEALEQVRRYHREGPELLAVLQLFGLTNLPRFFYGATWSLSRRTLFDWRDEQAGDFETLVKTFVAPRRVLRAITDFILFTRKDEELSKVILRPHQMRAVERVQRRAKNSEKRRGLVWHTQGSGKTYSMITVAKKLIEDSALNDPTVLMVVDRNELEAQLFSNLEAVGFGHVELARSKRNLTELLERDQRGLIVSMIHKFDDIPANVNLRENIFVLVDEAHRTTGGELGNYLMGALPNATYIGFTGTPIDKTAHGRGTFKTFGKDDEQGYLDKYSIRESIEDGTTVPLHYSLAPNDLLVDRETLNREFLDLARLEGVSHVEELDWVLERAVTLKNMLKNPDRVAKVASFVAEHFCEVIDPTGFKAFLVAPDREGCALYKDELDKHLPSEWSEVVISSAHNDPPELAKLRLGEEEEQRIRRSFRKPDELPKILIVTEKLLTGYDAPILYAMYLDKPLRDHVLLQAIARVNRPYEDNEGRRKPSGFILDFVGIFERLEKALAFDSDEVSGVVEGLEVLQERFENLMRQGREEYLHLWDGLLGDKATEAVLEHFRDQERREGYYKYFRELEELYEILSPAPFLSPYLRDYDQLSRVYQVLRAAYEPHVTVDRSFLRKTEKLVQEYTHTPGIAPIEAEYALTPEVLRGLVNQNKADTVKVFNLLISIRKLVEEQASRMPYLISIGERAEAIAEAFEEHLSDAQKALAELTQVVEELEQAEERRKQSDLPDEAFAALLFLERSGVDGGDEVAEASSKAFEENLHWRESADQEKEVRLALYRALKDTEPKRMFGLVDDIINILKRASS